jgi:DNA-binding IclR family transcriptional regulator
MEIARLHGLYAASQSLDRIVLPVLRSLAATTGESAAYHVRQDQGDSWVRLCQFRVDSSHVVRDHVRVGDLLPNDRGAGARVLIAFGPEAEQPRGTKERKLYDSIRAQGYCALVGDRTAELAGISAPVFHADGSLAAAVTLTMPTHRYDERYIEPVQAAARELGGQV